MIKGRIVPVGACRALSFTRLHSALMSLFQPVSPPLGDVGAMHDLGASLFFR